MRLSRRNVAGIVLGLGLVATAVLAASTPRHGFNYTSDEGVNQNFEKLDNRIPPVAGGLGALLGVQSVVFCGQLPNNDTSWFFGPAGGVDRSGAGDGVAADAGGTACDAGDNTTEGTADFPIWTTRAIKPIGMVCRAVDDAGATGSGSSGVTMTLRVNAADASPAISCTVATTALECSSFPTNTVAGLQTVAANTPMAVATGTTENLSANDAWCRVYYVFAD